ncbi:phosphoribosylaminoimidazole synthetase [Candidatus Sulfobium mesophilum]|uniref:Phosphoribosylformylglycinamidine cyclo-ligase n=1 Tax=Candidatus Sulfobium mesophilum TaxID=2016548 RepID=A0A2U3QFI4_9BACT|nr:phosphoribosylaminoimidazole synthetase [Candidatus Sulfobium mesophilum]
MATYKRLTYKKAGVDIDEGDRFVGIIKPLVRKTFRPEVMADIGSFGALFKLDIRKYKEPILVSGTDGVGTKLKIAFMTGRHDTVGIDLVAMCVNDILTSGAEPLFFLDYFATGKLKPEKAAEVIKGIANGCLEAGCSLVGGETAEMPGFYESGEYDLSGFAVGVVDKKKIIDGARIKDGDALIGIPSSGLHSNGYSLARKVLFDFKKMSFKKILPQLGIPLGEELLKPTRIYVKTFKVLREKVDVRGIAHITGGGIPGNLPRIFPKGLGAVLFEGSWPEPAIFSVIRNAGNVPEEDMRRTFNMGVGLITVVSKEQGGIALAALKKKGIGAYLMGKVKKGISGVRYE